MYKVVVNNRARKDIRKLTDTTYKRIRRKLLSLSENPRPREYKKLQDEEDKYRIRVGDYRILYSIDDGQKTVLINRIVHRREAYR